MMSPVFLVGPAALSLGLDEPLDVVDARQDALAQGDGLQLLGRLACLHDVVEDVGLQVDVLLEELVQQLDLGILLVNKLIKY